MKKLCFAAIAMVLTSVTQVQAASFDFTVNNNNRIFSGVILDPNVFGFAQNDTLFFELLSGSWGSIDGSAFSSRFFAQQPAQISLGFGSVDIFGTSADATAATRNAFLADLADDGIPQSFAYTVVDQNSIQVFIPIGENDGPLLGSLNIRAHINSVETAQPVPVPAALPLFASVLAGLLWAGWRRRA